mmetsp:Transcript_13436/g.27416  ORF Transcript_13436/g.27416 Transcript_13436/m.27416 type:complete len:84 (-) Transcript_13436:592-843(-)
MVSVSPSFAIHHFLFIDFATSKIHERLKDSFQCRGMDILCRYRTRSEFRKDLNSLVEFYCAIRALPFAGPGRIANVHLAFSKL